METLLHFSLIFFATDFLACEEREDLLSRSRKARLSLNDNNTRLHVCRRVQVSAWIDYSETGVMVTYTKRQTCNEQFTFTKKTWLLGNVDTDNYNHYNYMKYTKQLIHLC